MGQAYYYFTASLPMIDFDSEPPMSSQEFISDCRSLLSDEDRLILEGLIEFAVGERQQAMGAGQEVIKIKSDTINRVAEFNRNFLNEAAAFRAGRAHKDPFKYIRGLKCDDPICAEVVNEAVKTPNLLEGEKIIEQFRWRALDDLVANHHFDLEFIIVYGIKLRIIERFHKFKSNEGSQIFDEIKKFDISDKLQV